MFKEHSMHQLRSHNFAIALVSFLMLGPIAQHAAAQKVIYIVRHAEKEMSGTDPDLSSAGRKRAQALADLLKNANIKAIYTGSAARTKQTAKPLADALTITPEAIPDGNPDKTFESAIHKHWNEAILIVGHSDTIEPLLKKWATSAAIHIDDTDFSTLLIVTPEAPDKAGWIRLRYESQ
jgi:broad specificity phosphatase PhoE